MGKPKEESERSERPEIFWILFLLVSAGVFLTVVEPARRETAEVRRRLEEVRAKLEATRRKIDRMRRERRALERGDPEAMKAAYHNSGLAERDRLRRKRIARRNGEQR
jgi:type II secretory pathway component PulM